MIPKKVNLKKRRTGVVGATPEESQAGGEGWRRRRALQGREGTRAGAVRGDR